MNVDLNVVIQTIIGMAKLVFQNLQEVVDDDEDEEDELPKITVQTETIHQVTMTEFVELLQKILRK
jgi:F420-dependent methylenetetrahydromethanopterin dehydrogenase